MENAKKLIVRAHIPSSDNPEAHVLHVTGTEPLEVGTVRMSQEQLLNAMGQRVFMNGYLSIDAQESRRYVYMPAQKTTVNVSDLITKPIDRQTVQLSQDYKWSDQ